MLRALGLRHWESCSRIWGGGVALASSKLKKRAASLQYIMVKLPQSLLKSLRPQEVAKSFPERWGPGSCEEILPCSSTLVGGLGSGERRPPLTKDTSPCTWLHPKEKDAFGNTSEVTLGGQQLWQKLLSMPHKNSLKSASVQVAYTEHDAGLCFWECLNMLASIPDLWPSVAFLRSIHNALPPNA